MFSFKCGLSSGYMSEEGMKGQGQGILLPPLSGRTTTMRRDADSTYYYHASSSRGRGHTIFLSYQYRRATITSRGLPIIIMGRGFLCIVGSRSTRSIMKVCGGEGKRIYRWQSTGDDDSRVRRVVVGSKVE